MQTIPDILSYFEIFTDAVIAFSGGVDSTLVAVLGKQALGERAHVVSFVTPLIPRAEIEEAKSVSDALGLNARFIELNPFVDERVKHNHQRRCYFCKHLLFSKLAEHYPNTPLFDGTNADDLFEDRPGLQALTELNVHSPLAELGITKKQIRELAHELKLPNTHKPSAPCLATRFSYGEELLPEKIARIERSEAMLQKLYAGNFRVRLRNERLIFELK